MKDRLQILKHSGYLLAARLFSRLASLPFLLYAAATLGPSPFGIVAFVLAAVEMLAAAADMGLSRYSARGMIRDESRRGKIAGMTLFLQLMASLLLVAFCLAAMLAVSPPEPKREALLIGLVAVVLTPFIVTTDSMFTATRMFGASAIFSVTGRLIYVAAGFAALKMGYSVVAVLVAYLLGIGVESLFRMIYALVKVDRISFGFSLGQLLKFVRGTLPFAATVVATMVYFRADTLILAVFRGDEEVGIYNAAYSLFSFFVWVPIVVTRSLFPSLVSGYASEERGAEASNWFWYRAVGMAGVPVAFTMTILAGPVFELLFPAAYSESAITLAVLMWSVPSMMMVSVGVGSLIAHGRERAVAIGSMATAVIIVLLDFILIPPFGVRGASWAMVVATGLWLLLAHLLLRRYVLAPGQSLAGAFGAPLAGGTAMAAAALSTRSLGLYAALAAGLIAYGVTLAAIALAGRRWGRQSHHDQ